MTYRPYFKHGIEQLQALVTTSRGDLKALKAIQYELGFRDRPKARALKSEVDDLLRRLASGGYVPPAQQAPTASPPPPAKLREPPQIAPNRVAVECATAKRRILYRPWKGLYSIYPAQLVSHLTKPSSSMES